MNKRTQTRYTHKRAQNVETNFKNDELLAKEQLRWMYSKGFCFALYNNEVSRYNNNNNI